MATHVAGYADEWRATLEDPAKLRRFVSFVNAPDSPDPDLIYVHERGQRRPATAAERPPAADNDVPTPVPTDGDAPASGPILIAGPTLQVAG